VIDAADAKRLFGLLEPVLDERMRRLVSGAIAAVNGRGGVSLTASATGVSRRAIGVGIAELKEHPQKLPSKHTRRPGGGRKRLSETDATLKRDLERLVDPTARGDPESPLRWTGKSVRVLACELRKLGHRVCPQVVDDLLHGMGFSLRGNVKTLEGTSHPDRDRQFDYINRQMESFLQRRDPAISVDTKKKELVGDFKNSGREWQPRGYSEKVRVHDFVIPELGRASPFGVYDLASNQGWVSVGTDHDTSAFAVQTIRRWWYSMGRDAYGGASRLLITADGGGSNGSRVRLWKTQLQALSDESGLEITVCHLPPGTSKWNKIEHRLFSFITMNWRGKPLISHEVIVNLISSTTTSKGLKVHCELDSSSYPAGVKVPDKEMAELNIRRHDFHGDWNYTISPRSRSK
jgi:hypothetical protein